MKKGFTILELLVVISVLAILIGIAIPRFNGVKDAAKIAEAKAVLKTMQSALESYYTNANPKDYPPTTNFLGSLYLGSATPRIISSTPPYDPFGSTTTTEYKYKHNGKYYVVGSVGTGSDLSTLDVDPSTGAVTKASGNLCVTNGTGC